MGHSERSESKGRSASLGTLGSEPEDLARDLERGSRQSPSDESTATDGSAESFSCECDEVKSPTWCSRCSTSWCSLRSWCSACDCETADAAESDEVESPTWCSRCSTSWCSLRSWCSACGCETADAAESDEADDVEASGASLIPRFLVDVLNGISQVCFVTNSVSGAIFILAILIGTPRAAIILSILGGLSATGLAACFGIDKEARKEGLLGYNGVLVGCSFSVHVENFLVGIVATIVSAGISAVVAAGLSRLMKKQLTSAFNIIALITLLGIHCVQRDHPRKHDSIFTWTSDFAFLHGLDSAKATLNGIAQMFFVSSPVSGILITLGICIASPFSALLSLLGSFIGALLGGACGANASDIQSGFFGYNGALIALWISLHFRALGFSLVTILACCGATAATAVYVGLRLAAAASNGYLHSPLTLPLCSVAFLLVASEHFIRFITMSTAVSQMREDCTDA